MICFCFDVFKTLKNDFDSHNVQQQQQQCDVTPQNMSIAWGSDGFALLYLIRHLESWLLNVSKKYI